MRNLPKHENIWVNSLFLYYRNSLVYDTKVPGRMCVAVYKEYIAENDRRHEVSGYILDFRETERKLHFVHR